MSSFSPEILKRSVGYNIVIMAVTQPLVYIINYYIS